jgi:hypothetical protein
VSQRASSRLVLDADRGAVLVAAPLELHVVEEDEQVDLGHAVEVPEPGQEMRLVDGDFHGASLRTVSCRVCGGP